MGYVRDKGISRRRTRPAAAEVTLRQRVSRSWTLLLARHPRFPRFVVVLLFLGIGAIAITGCATAGAEQSASSAVERTTEAHRAVLGVRTDRHLNVALLTARQMFEGAGGYAAEQVTIVVCGEAVRSLGDDSVRGEIERIRQTGDVRVVACGITVDRMGLDPNSFAPGVEVVPNGLVEMARLQALGYQSVEL